MSYEFTSTPKLRVQWGLFAAEKTKNPLEQPRSSTLVISFGKSLAIFLQRAASLRLGINFFRDIL